MSDKKHYGHFVVIHHPVTAWVVTCGQHFTASGATYATTEDHWRQHVHAVTGKAPKPLGDQTARWMPDGGGSDA